MSLKTSITFGIIGTFLRVLDIINNLIISRLYRVFDFYDYFGPNFWDVHNVFASIMAITAEIFIALCFIGLLKHYRKNN